MSDTKNIINVNGLDIKTNSIYKVTNKPDSSAPSGFRNLGTTKLPSVGIGNTVPVRFVKDKYDTGFYKESPCYSHMADTEANSQVRKITTSIVKPYEKLKGKGTLDVKNSDFWDSYGVNLFEGRYFDTSKVEDLFDLYIAMRSFELTPKDAVGNPKFNDSQFCIEDKEEVRSIETERANDMMKAIGECQAIIKSNYSKALNIFRYLGVLRYNQKVSAETLNTSAFQWLNSNQEENPKRFRQVFAMAEKDETEDVVDLYVLCNKLFDEGIIDRKSGHFTYKGKQLGADLKTVANNLNSKKDLKDVKLELLEKTV